MADLTDFKIFLAGLLRPIVADAVREEFQRIGTTPTPPPDETGGIDLAHQVTGLSNARIYALVSAREIPHAKRGNRLHFNRADLAEWIRQGRREERKEPKATRTNRHV